MFQDESFDPVEFATCWKKERTLSEAHTQTSEVLTYEAAVQTAERASVSVQTDEEPEKPFSLVVDNSRELKEFLTRVEPLVSEQLRRNLESHAFDGYEVSWEEESTAVSCLHTLEEASQSSQFHCTGLAWNCTGSVLAASYGRFDHQDWCSHKSMLCTWNLDRRSIDSTKADISIDIPSCLMCLSFHPSEPAVVAGGSFSGEVLVWNTGREGDPLLASSGFTDLGHKEPVAKVSWMINPEEHKNKPLLLSLGNDGKILVWKHTPEKRELQLMKGSRLLSGSIPRSLRVGRSKGDIEMGGTCLSFSHEDKTVLVVGSENGGLLKCSLPTPAEVNENTTEADFKSPIEFAFRPHHGPVYSVSCSSFHRNLFLSCGTDSTARLYSMIDSAPLLLVEPSAGYLFSVCWSPTRPLVFAMGTGDGHVLIYDLKGSHIKPRVSLDASPHKRAVFAVEYNQRRCE